MAAEMEKKANVLQAGELHPPDTNLRLLLGRFETIPEQFDASGEPELYPDFKTAQPPFEMIIPPQPEVRRHAGAAAADNGLTSAGAEMTMHLVDSSKNHQFSGTQEDKNVLYAVVFRDEVMERTVGKPVYRVHLPSLVVNFLKDTPLKSRTLEQQEEDAKLLDDLALREEKKEEKRNGGAQVAGTVGEDALAASADAAAGSGGDDDDGVEVGTKRRREKGAAAAATTNVVDLYDYGGGTEEAAIDFDEKFGDDDGDDGQLDANEKDAGREWSSKNEQAGAAAYIEATEFVGDEESTPDEVLKRVMMQGALDTGSILDASPAAIAAAVEVASVREKVANMVDAEIGAHAAAGAPAAKRARVEGGSRRSLKEIIIWFFKLRGGSLTLKQLSDLQQHIDVSVKEGEVMHVVMDVATHRYIDGQPVFFLRE